MSHRQMYTMITMAYQHGMYGNGMAMYGMGCNRGCRLRPLTGRFLQAAFSQIGGDSLKPSCCAWKNYGIMEFWKIWKYDEIWWKIWNIWMSMHVGFFWFPWINRQWFSCLHQLRHVVWWEPPSILFISKILTYLTYHTIICWLTPSSPLRSGSLTAL